MYVILWCCQIENLQKSANLAKSKQCWVEWSLSVVCVFKFKLHYQVQGVVSVRSNTTCALASFDVESSCVALKSNKKSWFFRSWCAVPYVSLCLSSVKQSKTSFLSIIMFVRSLKVAAPHPIKLNVTCGRSLRPVLAVSCNETVQDVVLCHATEQS